jgi:putative protease
LGEWTHSYGSRATRKKVFAGKCTNFFKNISVAEFYLEATKEIREGDELLITGETTGAYELVAHDIHDAKGKVRTEIHKGEYFAIKTDKMVRRGDRIFLLKVEE